VLFLSELPLDEQDIIAKNVKRSDELVEGFIPIFRETVLSGSGKIS